MTLSRLSEKCQACPDVLTCTHKKMELCACFEDKSMLENSIQDNVQPNLMPIARETMQINVGGVMTSVYKDEIEKEIYKALHQPFSLNYGKEYQ